MTSCRILLDTEPASGSWNMAVDEVLLESAVQSGTCSVRLYQWSEPTVSLGHFQDQQAAIADPGIAELAVVRRLSGGGAILHHHEITYSCAVPAGHPAIRNPTDLYNTAHAAIIGVLQKSGVSARLRGHEHPGSESAFLCFSRSDPHDIVFSGHKIVGSAQRRRRGAVLQHGSLLMRASEFAPEHRGLADLIDCSVPPIDLARMISEALARELADSICFQDLTSAEQHRAREIESHA